VRTKKVVQETGEVRGPRDVNAKKQTLSISAGSNFKSLTFTAPIQGTEERRPQGGGKFPTGSSRALAVLVTLSKAFLLCGP